MTSRSRLRNIFAAGFLFAGLFTALGSQAHAQAVYTASRLAELDAFAGYTYTTPDYSYFKDNGVAFGADYIRYNHTPWAPAFEFRAMINSGPVISEDSYLFGVRVHREFKGRYRPYVNVLAGEGTAKYLLPPNSSGQVLRSDDKGLVLSYGLGMDIQITRDFMFKADGQQQHWSLGPNSYTAPGKDQFTLGPVILTVGVNYRIPFKSHTRAD